MTQNPSRHAESGDADAGVSGICTGSAGQQTRAVQGPHHVFGDPDAFWYSFGIHWRCQSAVSTSQIRQHRIVLTTRVHGGADGRANSAAWRFCRQPQNQTYLLQ
jgi:hypothetical protein